MAKFHPDDLPEVIPYLVVPDGNAALRFLDEVLAGVVQHETRDPDHGRLRHATVKIGGAAVMLGEANGPWPAMPAAVYVYVPNVDETYQKALHAGATSIMAPTDTFYGDRGAGVKDGNGITWWLATHMEDLTRAELERRSQEEFWRQKAARTNPAA